MNKRQIIERLKPITKHLWWCNECNCFLEHKEVGYAMGNNHYCHKHIHNDLSIEARENAYVKIVEELVEDMHEEIL